MQSSRSSVEADRYRRNGLSLDEQQKLHKARVAVIGCGGLGGRTAELLLRLGIRTLTLVDPDSFTSSNLNRQIFCTKETLGQKKAAVLARELLKIDPEATVQFNVRTFSKTHIQHVDLVIDGLDSGAARCKLAELCRQQAVPLIHGAVQQWYGQVGVDQSTSPLINTLYTNTNGGASPDVLPMTVALVSAIQAAEACKYILKRNSTLQKNWLQCDLSACDYQVIKQEKQ